MQDMRCPGLELRVTANGVKSWSFRYRDRTTGKTERKTLGRYPDVSQPALVKSLPANASTFLRGAAHRQKSGTCDGLKKGAHLRQCG